MDIAVYASYGLLFGAVIHKYGSLIQTICVKCYLEKLFNSPLVQQVLNITMGLTPRQATEVMINISKEIAIVLLNTIVLLANLAKEVLVLFKHLFIVVKATVNMMYIFLSSINFGIQKIFDISYLFSKFLTKSSTVYTFWGSIFFIFLVGFIMEKIKMNFRAQQSCKISDHSGIEEQVEQPGNYQLSQLTQQELQVDQTAE